MKFLMLLILPALVSFPAYASKIIGNGGYVMICPNRTPKVQLLDFVDSRILRKNKIQLWDPPGATYVEKLEQVLNRIDMRFPNLARTIREEVANFEQKNTKEDDIQLEDIRDSHHKVLLSGCRVEPVANQATPMLTDDPWFLINATLWNQMSEMDKAGLVLHEVLYRMGLRYSLEHSVGVRYLTSLFFQENLSAVADRQWVEGFLHSRIRDYEVGGLQFPLFWGDGTCRLLPGATGCAQKINITPNFVLYDQTGRNIKSITFSALDSLTFRSGPLDVQISTTRFLLNWYNGVPEVEVEGDMSITKGGAEEAMFGEFHGRIVPEVGTINGQFRHVRPYKVEGPEAGFQSVVGNLRDLFAGRPPALLPRAAR